MGKLEARAENITETQALENAIRILARMIVEAIFSEISIQRKRLYEADNESVMVCTQTDPKKQEKHLVLTPTEAAKLLKIGGGTIYELIRTRQIPSIRFGRRIIIPRAALMKILAETGNNDTSAKHQLLDKQN